MSEPVTPKVEPTTADLALADQLGANAVDLLPKGALAQRLAQARADGRQLRVKFGIDPTSADIHLGHCVPLQVLRQFQDAGHLAVLIIGDYTARVGDPTSRSKTRPLLSPEQIHENALTYQDQAFRVLDRGQTEVTWNGQWLGRLVPAELFRMLSLVTVARILERDDFAKRYREQAPISLLELTYPLLQAYDSVAIKADIELGGTDQLYNLLMGRELMPHYGLEPQLVLTTPILTGTDGVQKMSKSLGNYVAVDDDPGEVFGKVMSIPDTAMAEWWRYAAGLQPADAGARIESGDAPNIAKRALARTVIERFHDTAAAEAAEARFDTMFKGGGGGIPDDAPQVSIGDVPVNDAGNVFLPALLVTHLGFSTNGEARRMLQQGAVKLDGEPLTADRLEYTPAELAGHDLQVGKRRWLRVLA